MLQVGEAFSDNDSVVIAKMDATANDIPSNKFDVSTACPCPGLQNTWLAV